MSLYLVSAAGSEETNFAALEECHHNYPKHISYKYYEWYVNDLEGQDPKLAKHPEIREEAEDHTPLAAYLLLSGRGTDHELCAAPAANRGSGQHLGRAERAHSLQIWFAPPPAPGNRRLVPLHATSRTSRNARTLTILFWDSCKPLPMPPVKHLRTWHAALPPLAQICAATPTPH